MASPSAAPSYIERIEYPLANLLCWEVIGFSKLVLLWRVGREKLGWCSSDAAVSRRAIASDVTRLSLLWEQSIADWVMHFFVHGEQQGFTNWPWFYWHKGYFILWWTHYSKKLRFGSVEEFLDFNSRYFSANEPKNKPFIFLVQVMSFFNGK